MVLFYGGNNIVPTLLPFFIATELLCSTGIIEILGNKLNKFMKPIFNVPGEGAFPFIMGIITGYPVGAKIVASLKENGLLSSVESERLIAFTNNSGPLFILGTVGIGLFKDSKTGILLLITHILASISVGIIFRWWKYKTPSNTHKKKTRFEPYKTSLSISTSITKSINTILLIGGFVVLFSVIISVLVNSKIIGILCLVLTPILTILHIPNSFAFGIISGLIEVTNGLYNVSNVATKLISKNIIISAFLLGFGGFCVAMQVYTIVSKSKISIKPYIIGKLLQGTFAAFYTYLILNTFKIISLDL